MLDADTGPFCFNGHFQVDLRYIVSTYFQIMHYLGTGLNFHNWHDLINSSTSEQRQQSV